MYRLPLLVFVLVMMPMAVFADGPPAKVPPSMKVAPGDWPQYRGPNRTAVSAETDLLQKWSTEGPPLLWKISNVGEGLGSVSVVGGRVYLIGYRETDELVIALDLGNGKEIWATSIGKARENRAMQFLRQRQPLVEEDRLYAVSAEGGLFCLNTNKGQILWQKSYQDDFGGRRPHWGWCDHPLIDGNKLICTPGGKKATIVALNKFTGKLRWKSVVMGEREESNSYAATVVTNGGGVRQYVHFLSRGLASVAAEDGKLLWRYSRVSNGTANAPTPIVMDDYIFTTGGYGTGSALLKLAPDGKDGVSIEERYFTKDFQNVHGGMVRISDYVYGGHSGGFGRGIFTCLEWKIGKILWQTKGPSTRSACVLAADGHLYARYIDGIVTLVKASPSGYKEISQFTPTTARYGAWTAPVISHGRLFLRQQENLLCFDLRKKSQPIPPPKKEGKPAKSAHREPDAEAVPTPHDIVAKMLELAQVKKTDIVYDLGSGDGRIVIAAAQKYGAQAVGVELDPGLVKLSRRSVEKLKLGDRVRIEHKDLFKVDLGQVDVVTLYLLPRLNLKLVPQLKKLKKGARVVSHAFPIPGFEPDRVVQVTSMEDGLEHLLYVWTAPLKEK